VRLTLATIAALALIGCLATGRRGDIIDTRDYPSPDGCYVVTVFGETFHNTTGYARHVYLHRAGEKTGYPGNVCIVPVGDELAVSWRTPTNLVLRFRFETPRSIPPDTNIIGVAVSFAETRKLTE
jgi:hypothetical protein